MDGFVAQKLNDFETGKISRRKLIETLTLAATTAMRSSDSSRLRPGEVRRQKWKSCRRRSVQEGDFARNEKG